MGRWQWDRCLSTHNPVMLGAPVTLGFAPLTFTGVNCLCRARALSDRGRSQNQFRRERRPHQSTSRFIAPSAGADAFRRSNQQSLPDLYRRDNQPIEPPGRLSPALDLFFKKRKRIVAPDIRRRRAKAMPILVRAAERRINMRAEILSTFIRLFGQDAGWLDVENRSRPVARIPGQRPVHGSAEPNRYFGVSRPGHSARRERNKRAYSEIVFSREKRLNPAVRTAR
jgi:hypothetical protein